MNELQATLCAAFEAMDRNQQMDLLQKEGVYVGKLKTGQGNFLLYQYQSIYIEIRYAVHRRHISAVHCFVDTSVLDRYFSSEDFEKP